MTMTVVAVQARMYMLHVLAARSNLSAKKHQTPVPYLVYDKLFEYGRSLTASKKDGGHMFARSDATFRSTTGTTSTVCAGTFRAHVSGRRTSNGGSPVERATRTVNRAKCTALGGNQIDLT